MTAASSTKPAWLLTKAIIIPTLRKATKGLLHGKSVLDVACSTGDTTRELVRWGATHTYAFDRDPEIVKMAKKKYSHVKEMMFGVEDMSHYKERNKYDLVTAINAYNYLNSREKLAVALKNAQISLKEDGVLVGFIPNGIKELNPREKDAIRLGAGLEMPQELWRDGLPTKMNFYSDGRLVKSSPVFFYFRKTYEDLLLAAGFKKVEWINPSISSEALIRYSDDYFQHYLGPPKDIAFRAFKIWK